MTPTSNAERNQMLMLVNEHLQKQLPPKARSLALKNYHTLRGEPHPKARNFKVYCWFSARQRAAEGSQFWKINGKPVEATFVTYQQLEQPDYADAVCLGVSNEFHLNGFPKPEVQQAMRRKGLNDEVDRMTQPR